MEEDLNFEARLLLSRVTGALMIWADNEGVPTHIRDAMKEYVKKQELLEKEMRNGKVI